MAQRVAAIFASREAAERAADALVDLGAEREHVSMLARGEAGTITTTAAEDRDMKDVIEPASEVGDTGAPMTTAEDEDAAKGAATGAAIGTVAGLAAGALALTVPGIGLVLAAGPLAWALGGVAGSAAAGAIAGGIYGGLRDIGIEEPHARGYEERIRGGDVLLTALVPSVAEDRILDVLAEHGAEDVSFADDTPIAQMPSTAAGTIIEGAHYPRTDVADRDLATTTPAEVRTADTAPSTTASVGGMATTGGYNTERTGAGATSVPSSATPTNFTSQDPNRDTASWAESPVGAAATTGAAFDSDIARGQAKQVEGEARDRAADRTANPVDDLAAKAKKVEGKVQEEYGEATETIEPRKP